MLVEDSIGKMESLTGGAAPPRVPVNV